MRACHSLSQKPTLSVCLNAAFDFSESTSSGLLGSDPASPSLIQCNPYDLPSPPSTLAQNQPTYEWMTEFPRCGPARLYEVRRLASLRAFLGSRTLPKLCFPSRRQKASLNPESSSTGGDSGAPKMSPHLPAVRKDFSLKEGQSLGAISIPGGGASSTPARKKQGGDLLGSGVSGGGFPLLPPPPSSKKR